MSESSELGKLLPNIKVTVGDETQVEENLILEEGEVNDSPERQSSVILTKEEFAFQCQSSSNIAKLQAKQYGGFHTNLDLSSEHLITKLQNRASRFNLKKEEQQQITSKEIRELYKSLGIDPENLESSCKNVRLGVIHMRGVTEMNNEEVLGYFKDYGPAAVEWINDVSCNVCWYDDLSAARALLGVSQPLVIKTKNKNVCQIKESFESCGSSIEIDKTEGKEDFLKHNTGECTGTQSEPQVPMEFEEESDDSISGDDQKNLQQIPIPPGKWRIGISHPKASTILLRFATKDDKKLPGAEKRSRYYQKYGNPNYGGLRGIITNSRKRKFQAIKTREMVDNLSSTKEDHTTDIKRIRRRLNIPVDRMRMYADIEEEKNTKRYHSLGRSAKHQSVKSRLGKRYSKDDLLKIGSQFSYEEEAPVEELSVECKIPSRFSIWNEQAKAMAREGLEDSEEENDRSDEVEEDEQLDEEEEEDEEYNRRDRRYCAYSSERASYEIQKQRNYSDFSKDLRQALNSRHRNNAPRGDLRSRISNLKNDAKPQKHRSPLLRDDL